jgi:hypothetical protein
MTEESPSLARRSFLTTVAAAGAVGLLPRTLLAATTDSAIRPFRVHIPEAALADLRRRLAATRWPAKETVADASQGVPLAKLQPLVRYWEKRYDWRKAEAKLNALPQYMTNIDGVDIHFIHVRSRHPNAMPLLITHGWPGSIFEFLKLIGPLTDPTAFGGRAEDAFDLVIPSIPGYGFSGKPTVTGWDPERIARAWAELMKRLKYNRYVAQGGDWGAPITSAMARQAAPGLHPPEPACHRAARSHGRTGRWRGACRHVRAGARRVRCTARLRQEGQLGLLHHADRTAADDRLWHVGFAGLPGGADAGASGLCKLDVRRRCHAVARHRRSAG